MELLTGAEMVVRFLRDEGVKHIYGYPGGALLHIYDALFKEPALNHILVRHEQAATHMADGYARATGKAGVVLVTSGPGATNAITGIATAYMDSIPMVVLSGQVPSNMVGTDAFQETDMVGISRPIVKHSFIIKHPSEIPEVLKKAFYLAESGRPGPVVVDIPKDMGDPTKKYEYVYPKKVKLRSYNPAQRGHSGQIRKAVEMLVAAKRPILYAGGGVILGGASGALTELARLLNLPVTNTLMGLGAYPGSDRQFLGMLGMHGSYPANLAMHHSDVILAVGARFDDRVINGAKRFCPNAKIIHVDIDPASISKTIKADVPIVGPVDSVLAEMVAVVRELNEKPHAESQATWWKQIEEWRGNRGLFPYNKGDGSIIKPQTVIETLYDVTAGDAYITSDVGQHQMFAAQYYLYDKPNRWINSGGLGTMGFGFPAAMGVKLNFPDADVACVTGEGSVQMNIQELSTCMQYDLPVKIVCLNNGALGMVRQWQDMQYSSRYSHSYMESLPDFVKLAEAYGHVGMRIQRLEDLKPMMAEAFAMKDRLVFLDIAVDNTEHVYPMQIKDGAMRDMWLSKTERT
ncbi:acetolactate synthase 3 catalytic subunit [Pseudomonas oryzihabitans]|uniref:acetolactate synthase 3 large subunit n=1 Tax=Pseudomonas rhizoryzae TaxID=2571129 RepID=UPI0007368E55|nr:acetolactate synthase 3 large subunit [Pseudomonas rhizoryzae]APQ13013.1 acetolactate synthase, large subunit, biosynthetic type [Pseudomonas psychrotolerans]KTS72765.1 acetolactate synthase 3 catalytic subunit [Pseudomonas psychrotolerans]KTS98183.1 acetolactate synthase 3 catalytic subunit [Pseudomonas psychrotolerans]KTT10829.1 acetolactate synthase 3 catalytic subunit [Pseudomonas psychrotolerans]KTT22554.1 acetolactate synthase 3 catalytic subunit [Pseudomonas psychrotolerans]